MYCASMHIVGFVLYTVDLYKLSCVNIPYQVRVKFWVSFNCNQTSCHLQYTCTVKTDVSECMCLCLCVCIHMYMCDCALYLFVYSMCNVNIIYV